MIAGAVASVCRDADDVARLVVRHHRMRVAKHPVLTVVAGPVAAARRVLAALDRGLGRDVVLADEPGAAAVAWVGRLAASPRLRVTLAARLGAGGASVSLRAARTLYDWRRLLGAARLDDSEASARLAQAIAAEDAAGLLPLIVERGRFAVAALDRLAALVGVPALPGLRVQAQTMAQLDAAVALSVALVDRPPLSAEVLAPWSIVIGWLGGPSGARSRGLAADGLVRLPDQGVRVLQRFRSKPERLLHQALEADASTRGYFHANVRPDLPGVARRPEVDLLCARLRLVIEVDGYFHLQDGARARDAARDRLLAAHHYQVTRVGADAVVADVAEIARQVRTIVLDALAHDVRRGR
jgi:very-short-patch-repair endonuclease